MQLRPLISASLLTGDDLKASKALRRRSESRAIVPVPATSGGKSKFEVPARSYTIIQWSL